MGGLRKFIVKAEPWQVFLIFLMVIIIYGITPEERETLKIIASGLLAIVIFGWFFILGTSLNENLPENQQKSDVLFIVSCFYSLTLVIVMTILKDVQFDEELMRYKKAVDISFVLSSFYIIYFASVLFSDNQDRLIEKDKLRAESIFILFIGFIFGVWILQSRVQKFFI